MRRGLALLLGLFALCAAQAQGQAPEPRNVAIVSLIGDVMTVDTYRPRVGTGIDTNKQEVVPVPTPAFDHVALLAAEDALKALLPAASLATLAVPRPGSDADPARLLAEGGIAPTNALIAGLRQQGFTHLLVLAKHRALARLQLTGLTVGSGYLSGLGFYIDNHLGTTNRETNTSGQGFVAPYVYIRLVLVDLASLQIQRQQVITASTSRSAADNPTGRDPWGAMSAADKVGTLNRLIEERIPVALKEMLQPR